MYLSLMDMCCTMLGILYFVMIWPFETHRDHRARGRVAAGVLAVEADVQGNRTLQRLDDVEEADGRRRAGEGVALVGTARGPDEALIREIKVTNLNTLATGWMSKDVISLASGISSNLDISAFDGNSDNFIGLVANVVWHLVNDKVHPVSWRYLAVTWLL
jgi:hypothetical protein